MNHLSHQLDSVTNRSHVIKCNDELYEVIFYEINVQLSTTKIIIYNVEIGRHDASLMIIKHLLEFDI